MENNFGLKTHTLILEMLLMLGPIVVTGLHLYFLLEEVEKVILIEPNEDRINDLKKRSEVK